MKNTDLLPVMVCRKPNSKNERVMALDRTGHPYLITGKSQKAITMKESVAFFSNGMADNNAGRAVMWMPDEGWPYWFKVVQHYCPGKESRKLPPAELRAKWAAFRARIKNLESSASLIWNSVDVGRGIYFALAFKDGKLVSAKHPRGGQWKDWTPISIAESAKFTEKYYDAGPDGAWGISERKRWMRMISARIAKK